MIFLLFLGHNFGTTNARKSIKGSKDAYHSLESNKTLSHEIRLLSLLPEEDDVIQKPQNLP